LVDRGAQQVSAEFGLELALANQVLDTVGVLTDQPRFQVLFERGDYRVRLVLVVRRSDSSEAGLAGDDLQENAAVAPAPAGGDDLDVFDGKWRHAFGCAVGGLMRRCQRRCQLSPQQATRKLSTVHVFSGQAGKR